ncbi:MAG: DUF4245 domain-containing protein [Streptosporangiaceae bacterium]
MNRVLHGSVSALGCLVAAAVLIVAVPAPHAAEPVTISYRSDLAKLTQLAPYPAVAPAGLPTTWQPVSSGLAVGGANGAGTVTWQLGYATPDGALATLEETNAPAASFIQRMTNSGTPLGHAQIIGRTWTLSTTPARGQRSMYVTGADRLTLVVTGNASWTQLRELAASLHPVAG